jgi:glycosyltransferase involved in cell wall biosynthesis
MAKIKVAEILGDFGTGGVESFAANVFSHFDFDQFDIDFIIDQNSSCFFSEKLSSTPIKLLKIQSCKKPFNKELYSLLLANKYDIVHSHLNTLSVFPLHQAKKAGVLVRVSHSHSSCGKGKGELVRNAAKKFLSHFSLIYPNVLISCSDVAGNFQFGKKAFSSGRVLIVPNCVDVAASEFSTAKRAERRKELGLSSQDILIGNIGRFMPQKNQLFLISVLKTLREKDDRYHLVLFGSGSELENLKKQTIKNGLQDSVQFHDPTIDVTSFYSAFDIFALPSLYEGLPLTGLEAQANGVPSLFSSNITSSVLLNSNAQMLPLDIQIWVDTISHLDLTRVAPSQRLLANYSFESAAHKLEQIYKNALSQANSQLK